MSDCDVLQNGKTKFTIENATKTRVVLADTKIHILGSYQVRYPLLQYLLPPIQSQHRAQTLSKNLRIEWRLWRQTLLQEDI